MGLNAGSSICIDCLGNDELKLKVSKKAKVGRCDHCGNTDIVILLSDLADIIDKAFRNFYEPGTEFPYYVNESDNARYKQEGDHPAEIIQDLIESDDEIAEAIVHELSSKEQWDVIREGATEYYDPSSKYVAVSLFRHKYFDTWFKFKKRIKHKQRFFDSDGEKALKSIFDSLDNLDEPIKATFTKTYGPSENTVQIFRARRANSGKMAKLLLQDPKIQLGPPNPEIAKAGRMNSAGISVFYGAFDIQTCVAELRPPVGSFIVSAAFTFNENVKLFDFSVFEEDIEFPSLFEDGTYELITHWKFLQSFHREIIKPIQPEDEAIEYVPTQAVAEYVKNVLKYDGIIYSSAQIGGKKKNLVLFDTGIYIEREKTGDAYQDWMQNGEDPYYGTKRLLKSVENSAKILKVTCANYDGEDIDPEYLI